MICQSSSVRLPRSPSYLWAATTSLVHPPGYSALSKLNYLLLSDNRITDQVPSDLSTLTDLEALDLSKNRLSGSIPAEVVALPNLIYFDISNNELSGPAPTGFASTSFQATAEATYNIERNYFNGSANANITAGNGTISFCPNKLQGGFAQAALLPYSHLSMGPCEETAW
ncbi:hypothetical protein CLOP_g17696 [Closterium sp. NIES-67]|nr:hypothetical protein CLOP_g17696 [Closterium sp. NIES-67]